MVSESASDWLPVPKSASKSVVDFLKKQKLNRLDDHVNYVVAVAQVKGPGGFPPREQSQIRPTR